MRVARPLLRDLLLLFALSQRAMATCGKDTGGTCQASTCDASRVANCVDKKCTCADGFCSEGGTCKYKAECAAHSSCSHLSGSCCPPDENSTNLDCCASESFVPLTTNETCGKDTGANCHILNCKASRKAMCVDRQCVCPDGHCTAPDPEFPNGDSICTYRAECAFHPKCQGLLGDCCPGPSGQLDCCASQDLETSASIGAALGSWSLLALATAFVSRGS